MGHIENPDYQGGSIPWSLLLLSHVADSDATEDNNQNQTAKEPVCRTETKHDQLLLKASAASVIKPAS
jgi:hypothetical protein